MLDNYKRKIKILNEAIWENKIKEKKINLWLDNFQEEEKKDISYLLTQFIYFGEVQVKSLFKSIYRDLFKYNQIEKIRINNNDTLDSKFIYSEYEKILKKTRFISCGNISESGTSFMMPFRQENSDISKELIIHETEIEMLNEDIVNFVFIDDLCGSGNQIINNSKSALEKIIKKFPNANNMVYFMISTKRGKDKVKKESKFDIVDSVIDLDDSFMCFDTNSRHFKNIDANIDYEKIKNICAKYGKILMEDYCIKVNPSFEEDEIEWFADSNKFGYSNGQLLIGFNHNIPDNTLPIIWSNNETYNWNPIFERKVKL